MSISTPTKTPRTLFASQTVNPGTTLRGAIELVTAGGGFLTVKVTNGATGPTVQAYIRLYVAHASVLPATGAEGAVWKLWKEIPCGTTANDSTRIAEPIDIGIMNLQVEVSGNTVQPVTAEAYLSELTNILAV